MYRCVDLGTKATAAMLFVVFRNHVYRTYVDSSFWFLGLSGAAGVSDEWSMMADEGDSFEF